MALALLAQDAQYLGFGKATFFHKAVKIGKLAASLHILLAHFPGKATLATRPDVLRHVPVQQVASYLGITPESLSRIRRQVRS